MRKGAEEADRDIRSTGGVQEGKAQEVHQAQEHLELVCLLVHLFST